MIRPVIESFGSPEIFMLGLLGLSMVASLSGGSILKGLVAALLGLMLAMVGYSDSGAVPRYYFEKEYLIDGLPLVPMVLGIFALSELMELAVRNTSISRVDIKEVKGGAILDGIKDAGRHWWLALRCSFIGTYIGMLPGLGAAIADWVAYGHAMQTENDTSRFGKGDIRGVIAPEAANNATCAGTLLPTLAFGVPGSIGAAILLGALLIVGLKPGPEMLTTELDTSFSMVWSIVVANILATVLLLFTAKHFTKIVFLPGSMLVPGILIFVFMGAWMGGGDMGDWIVLLSMGVVGFFMKRGGWPRPPLVLALVLGGIMENSYILTDRVYDGVEWMQRPIVIGIALIIAVTLFSLMRGIAKRKKNGEVGLNIEGTVGSPIFSLPFAIVLFVFFALATWMAQEWTRSVKLFPVLLGTFGIVLTAVLVLKDSVDFRKLLAVQQGFGNAFRDASEQALFKRCALFFLLLICMAVIAVVLGQKIALPLLVGFYLRQWGNRSWRTCFIYAACVWVFLVGFYDRVMNIFWYESWLGGKLPALLPDWLPAWLFV